MHASGLLMMGHAAEGNARGDTSEANEGTPSEACPPDDDAPANYLLIDGKPLEFALGERPGGAPELRFCGAVVATQPPLADADEEVARDEQLVARVDTDARPDLHHTQKKVNAMSGL